MNINKTSNKIIERYLYAKNSLNNEAALNSSKSKSDKQIQSKNDANPKSSLNG